MFRGKAECREAFFNNTVLRQTVQVCVQKKLRGNKQFTMLDTRKDGVRFTNASLRQLNNQFQTLKEIYDDVQSKLVNEVIKIASNTTTGKSTSGHITQWGRFLKTIFLMQRFGLQISV